MEEVFKSTDKTPSDILGVEYLLRCLTKFPDFLAETEIDEANRKMILQVIDDIIRFINSKEEDYFLNPDKCTEYVDATPEYIAKYENKIKSSITNTSNQKTESGNEENTAASAISEKIKDGDNADASANSVQQSMEIESKG